MSGRQLRIVPYNGNRAYKYYLDGYKVNGKRRRLFFKDEAAAGRKLAELARQQKKEGQDGIDVPLDLGSEYRTLFQKFFVRCCLARAPYPNGLEDLLDYPT